MNPCGAVFLRLGVGIQLLIEALANHAALAHGKRRVFDDGLRNQCMDILKSVQSVMQSGQVWTLAARKNLLQQRQIFHGIFQCRQIPCVCILIHHTGHNTFKVIHGMENFLDFLSEEQVLEQLLHPIQTLIDFFFRKQGLLHPFAQKPCAHRSPGFIQNAQKRAFFVLLAHGFRQFQISAAGNIQQHEIPCCVIFQSGNMAQIVFLRFIQIPHQRTRSRNRQQLFLQAEAFQCFHLEMRKQGILCGIIFIHTAVDIVQIQVKPFLDFLRQRGGKKFAVADKLRRGKPCRFIQNFCRRLHAAKFRCLKFACRHIADRNAIAVCAAENGENVVIFCFIQNSVIHNRPRSNDTHNIALDQALCRLWVLHLLADGNLIATFHQTGNISIRGMERHAAHRGSFLLPPILPRQGDFQLLRGNDRILEKHLIKIP